MRYTGSGDSTDRGFTINGIANGHQATFESSGTGPVTFTNTVSPAYGTAHQTRALNLTGTNTGANTLAASIVNNGTAVVSDVTATISSSHAAAGKLFGRLKATE